MVFLILNVKGLQPQNDFPSQEFIEYATRFWKVIVKNVSKETNVFYCPMGLLRVLFMLELGADGESATQIRDATFSKNWRPHLNHYDKQNLTVCNVNYWGNDIPKKNRHQYFFFKF